MTYRYGPLHSPYDFRLLHVSPGVGDQPVHCRLAHDTLGGQTKYHALSYTWGSLEETSTVTVNGCLYNVTANLLSALSNLRHPKKESAFWVDRICIDQSNDDERSQQVAQMRDVYEKAENVDIWLGSHTEKYERGVMGAMERLGIALDTQKLEDKLRDDSCKEVHSEIQHAVYEHFVGIEQDGGSSESAQSIVFFLSLPWWTRIWVKQELAVARRAEFICGSQRLNWRYAELCLAAFRYLINRRVIDPRVDENTRFANLIIRRGFTLRLRFDVVPQKTTSLVELIFRHARSPIAEATDPRDRIDAFLGIAKSNLGLMPDYRITADELFCRFVKAQIRAHADNARRLSILSFHQAGGTSSKVPGTTMAFHRESNRVKVTGLPYWAPDFMVRAGNQMSSWEPTNPQRYAACGSGPMPSLPESFDDDLKTLVVHGIVFATVTHLGPSGSIGISSAPFSEREIFQKCQELAWKVEEFVLRGHEKQRKDAQSSEGSDTR